MKTTTNQDVKGKTSQVSKFMLLIFLSVFVYSSINAQIIYEQDFEKGGKFEKRAGNNWWTFYDGLMNSGNHPTIESTPGRSGKAAKFYLQKDATGTTKNVTYRTEATITDRKGNFDFGKEYSISFDYRYENWKNDSDGDAGPLQIHEDAPKFPDGKVDYDCRHASSAQASNPFSIMTQNNIATFYTFGGKARWSWSVKEKQWSNITVKFRLTGGSDGYIELWKDGTKMGRVNGVNAYTMTRKKGTRIREGYGVCNRDPIPMRPPYIKLGIYKWNWKINKDGSRRLRNFETTQRELWIDNIKVMAEGTLATDEFQNAIDVVVSPNPSSEELNIQFPEVIKIETISIYDVLGKEVFTKKIESSENKITLNPNLSSGVYFLKIASDKGELNKKIIIK